MQWKNIAAITNIVIVLGCELYMKFDYFYGTESNQFSFYRIPKNLITEDYFKSMSTDSKLLYGLMLDRMSLSRKNNWFDEKNRVYIIFTLEEVIELLNCSSNKCVQLFKELESFSLIIRKKRGQGKPAIIYILNLYKDVCADTENCENEKSELVEKGSQDFKKKEVKTCKKGKSRLVKKGSQDFKKTQAKNCENGKSGLAERESQDFPKQEANNININNTDYNNTDYQSYLTDKSNELMAKYTRIEGLVKQNIDYESLCVENNRDVQRLEEILSVIVDTVAFNNNPVSICDNLYPAEVVKNRFLKLRSNHIEYVLDCLNHNTTRVKNMPKYLLSTLYNSFLAADNALQSRVNADIYG